MMPAVVGSGVCAAAVAALLWAEFCRWPVLRAVTKTTASLAFVAVALSLGATATAYGQWVLLALLLSVAGDVALLGSRPVAFIAGLAAFLLAHVAFAMAFAVSGVSIGAAGAAAVVAAVVGVVVLRWLRGIVPAALRAPVVVYVVAILCMVSLAIGHARASGHWIVALAAALFAVSDLAVARDKFVGRAFANRAWGLPTYYAAQLMLAWSVA